MGAQPPVQCSQCDKPSVVAINDAALCVRCYHMFSVAQTLQFRLNAIAYNQAKDHIDFVVGLGFSSARYQVPDLPEPPLVLNNIQVDNSIVGAINTGTVQTIDVSISQLQNAGSEELSAALKQLTELIVNEGSLSLREKNELLDQVAYLSEQAVAPATERKPGTIKAVLQAVGDIAGTATKIEAAWEVVKPLIKSYFGL